MMDWYMTIYESDGYYAYGPIYESEDESINVLKIDHKSPLRKLGLHTTS